MPRKGANISLSSYDDIFETDESRADSQLEKVQKIPISELVPFKNHPFKVVDDEKMQELVESIRINGVLVPVLVRPDGRNGYEMVSGHRRMFASKLLGLETIPAIIRDMSRDEAVVAMVDANIQREELLPSEKAFAYKMKMVAMKHQGERSDLTLGQNVPKFKRTTEAIAHGSGESYKQVQRYIRLTELIPELLEMVDNKRLNFTIAVDISYIDKQIQSWLYEYISDNGFIKPNQISNLRQYLEQGNMTQQMMISILNSSILAKPSIKRVAFSEKKLAKYFPAYYTADDMERVIVKLLEEWKKEQEES